MEINKYHALCSNKILKLISSLASDDLNLSSLSNNYNSLFDEFASVNFIWPLVNTSLLMSENLYKYDKAYKLISDSTLELIENKLYLYPIIQPDDPTISPCLLDYKNNVASSFLNYIKCNFNNEDYYKNYIGDKYFFEEEEQFALMKDDLKETFENLRKDSSYGCNDAIIEDGFIDIRKFIERTRNALAHSNYEVIDKDHIRLYHYNSTTKKLDFNVILEPSIIVLIVDELNEIASEKYSYFMDFYHDYSLSELMEGELTDKRIIEYMMSFDMFSEEVVQDIFYEIKTNKEFLESSKKEDKVKLINEVIYEKIKPAYDAGIILNDYLYCDEKGKILDDELYQKYGVFNYLNSEYYNSSDVGVNDKIYIQNKFQFLLLSLLNCSVLNGYNITEGKDVGIIDFSKMTIDKDIMEKFLLKNGIKTLCVIELLEKEIEKAKKDIEEKSRLIEKRQDILMKNDIDNDYFNIVLPSQIKELEVERMELTTSSIVKSLEIKRAREQGSMYNFDKNISQFVFNHLRNSLAHGYVKFQNNTDLSNANDMIITFEDYNPDDKKELTFKGSIRLVDLLTIITSNQYVNNVLGISTSKSSDSVLTKK